MSIPRILTSTIYPFPHKYVANDEAAQTGVMVAFRLTPEQEEELAIPGGEAPHELHLTLVLLGNVGEDFDRKDEPRLLQAVREWAYLEGGPITGTISGKGVFTGGDSPVTYASVDAPRLPAARQSLIGILQGYGFVPNMDHGYTPHVTLSYSEVEVDPPNLELLFDAAYVNVAGSETFWPLDG